MTFRPLTFALLAAPLLLSDCATTPPPVASARADLLTAAGTRIGTVTAVSEGGTIRIALNVTGIEPGEHGVHVHTTGVCDAPAFQGAGGHWNPVSAMHGLEGAPGQHAGDMPNLVVAANGTGTLQYTLAGGTFAGLMDADGAAFVVHAARDDQATDPSGNSGARIACGVFAAG